MTLQEFDNIGFRFGDKAKYRDGNIYPIQIIDFEERLFGLLMNIEGGEDGQITFVRCENIELISPEIMAKEIKDTVVTESDFDEGMG